MQGSYTTEFSVGDSIRTTRGEMGHIIRISINVGSTKIPDTKYTVKMHNGETRAMLADEMKLVSEWN